VNDTAEVFSELLLRRVFFRIENHDSPTSFPDNGFNESKGDATQSVSVGNHKSSDAPLQAFVQNGLETFSIPVETGTDVFDDDMVWEFLLEELDLSLEVIALLGCGDPCIDEVLFSILIFVLSTNEDCSDLVWIIEETASRGLFLADESGIGPVGECEGFDTTNVFDISWWDPDILFVHLGFLFCVQLNVFVF